jgi:hypothetical protein
MTAENRWIWTWSALDISLHVHASVVAVLENYRQDQAGNERGGQLFVDVMRPDGLWLVEATPPHQNDKSGPTWLELDPRRCQEEIVKANAKGLRLIGYWHSHPEHVPALSGQDIKSLKEFSRQNSHQLPHPLAVIVGRSLSAEGIRAWVYQTGQPLLAKRA